MREYMNILKEMSNEKEKNNNKKYDKEKWVLTH